MLQREREQDEEFDDSIRCLVKFLARPLAAFNCSFEESWLAVKFDVDLFEKWRELSEKIRRKGSWTAAWPALSELVSGPYVAIGEREIMGGQLPLIWRDYLRTRNHVLLAKIIDHNSSDLLRDCCLLLWDDESMLRILSSLLREK